MRYAQRVRARDLHAAALLATAALVLGCSSDSFTSAVTDAGEAGINIEGGGPPDGSVTDGSDNGDAAGPWCASQPAQAFLCADFDMGAVDLKFPLGKVATAAGGDVSLDVKVALSKPNAALATAKSYTGVTTSGERLVASLWTSMGAPSPLRCQVSFKLDGMSSAANDEVSFFSWYFRDANTMDFVELRFVLRSNTGHYFAVLHRVVGVPAADQSVDLGPSSADWTTVRFTLTDSVTSTKMHAELGTGGGTPATGDIDLGAKLFASSSSTLELGLYDASKALASDGWQVDFDNVIVF